MVQKIQMTQLGRHGRGCNQLFQYAFLTWYARKYDAELQIPPWVGDHLFDLPKSKSPEAKLPVYRERGNGREHPKPPESDELIGKDFHGYAQYHTSYYLPGKAHFVKTFQPTGRVYDRLSDARCRLISGDDVVVGIHLRRGDYGQRIFPIIPTSWYLDWLESNVHLLGNVKLFIATEDPSLVNDFAAYDLCTTESLGLQLGSPFDIQNITLGFILYPGHLKHDIATDNVRALDWYPDFYLLSQCHVILGPSSTFSFVAAMLAPRLLEYWRASLKAETFVQVDPWDAYPQLREDVRDYPYLEGISLKSNPYW